MNITQKQEVFALKYVECGNASEAYRHAYNVGEEKSEWVKVEASKLLADPNVAITVLELQEQARERNKVTVDTITAELDEAREMAKLKDKPETMVSASNSKAKLHGLIVDRKDHAVRDGAQTGPTEILIIDATEETIAAQNVKGSEAA